MGVSINAINSALNELEARHIVIRRNGVGIFRSPNAGKRVISLVCDPTFFRTPGASPFWDMLIRMAEQRAESGNERLELHFDEIHGQTLSLPRSLVSDVEAGRVSGVLFVGFCQDGVQWIESHDVPVVVFAGSGPYKVNFDYEYLVECGARLLASNGCRRIGLMCQEGRVRDLGLVARSVAEDIKACSAARAGCGTQNYQDTFEKLDIVAIPVALAPKRSIQESSYQMASAMLRQPSGDRPDGLVLSDDLMTLGVLAAIQETKMVLGKDIRIASHVNEGSGILIGWEDRMTTLRVDPEMLVKTMFEMLERRMAGETVEDTNTLLKPVVRHERPLI
jgi:DNA-binding LacI/PurR family transcriptional regulator